MSFDNESFENNRLHDFWIVDKHSYNIEINFIDKKRYS